MTFNDWATKRICKGICRAMKVSYRSFKFHDPSISGKPLYLEVISTRPGWTVNKETGTATHKSGSKFEIKKDDTFADVVRNIARIEITPRSFLTDDAYQLQHLPNLVKVLNQEFKNFHE